MKKLFVLSMIAAAVLYSQIDSAKFYAGFRASRVLSSYPNRQFPQTEYWINVAKGMAQKFPGSTPAGIWILSLYQGAGVMQLSFPSGGLSIPNAQFTSVDYNESHLSILDTSGVKVWLQVEPGAAEMDTLISIVMNRYKHHSCVVGFGVDVEWFFTNTYSGGRKLTDSMVQRWNQKLKAVNPAYTLFVKHYGQSWMPPTYRGDILFVDDSQDFTFSGNPFSAMVSEFKSWGAKFSPGRTAFQFGYAKDSVWWKNLADPPKTIGDALRANIPNCGGVFWVDFTVTKIFPITSISLEGLLPKAFALSQNFPNPFNPSTRLEYHIQQEGLATLRVYDILGRERAILVNEEQHAGSYSVQWNASEFASGIYFAKLSSSGNTIIRKMMLVK